MSKSFSQNGSTYNVHDFDVPLTSVDLAIFGILDRKLKILLVKRAHAPAQKQWALPGGFIDLANDPSLAHTAIRILREKTAVQTPYLEQVETIGNATRDPRGWAVTVVYMALIAADDLAIAIDHRSEEAQWVDVGVAQQDNNLAFDHRHIIELCHARLKAKVQ